MTEVHVSKPVPEINALTRPFWDAAARGELRMQKCLGCNHIRFPVGPVCTKCLSAECDWVLLSGKGKVLTHLVFHRAYSAAWKDTVPYSVVMVQLPEGPRMFSDLLDPEKQFINADLVGRGVVIRFDPVRDDIVVPRFQIAD